MPLSLTLRALDGDQSSTRALVHDDHPALAQAVVRARLVLAGVLVEQCGHSPASAARRAVESISLDDTADVDDTHDTLTQEAIDELAWWVAATGDQTFAADVVAFIGGDQ